MPKYLWKTSYTQAGVKGVAETVAAMEWSDYLEHVPEVLQRLDSLSS